jgi:hypothetical protein
MTLNSGRFAGDYTDGQTDRKFLYGLLQDLQNWRFILHRHTSTAAAGSLQATFN